MNTDTAEMVELPHHQFVSEPQVDQARIELGLLAILQLTPVGEISGAADLGERGGLGLRMLVDRGDARAADPCHGGSVSPAAAR